jgi:dihydropteroate synthase
MNILKAIEHSSPLIMGILNVTPDSFSDGGKYASYKSALYQAEKMIEDGVDIIDIGGESTRPGALAVAEKDEVERVIPLLSAIKEKFAVKVSIDTSKAEVMRQAIVHGADMINDVRALQNEGCLAVLAESNLPVCLMHMQGLPSTMQDNPNYDDVISDIKSFFIERINACEQQGINRARLILDPGFGFGKTLVQNYQLLAQLAQFNDFGLPLLSGTSRKSMIGDLLSRKVDERLAGSIATAIIAAQQKANIIRVHDVKETFDALKILKMTASYQSS